MQSQNCHTISFLLFYRRIGTLLVLLTMPLVLAKQRVTLNNGYTGIVALSQQQQPSPEGQDSRCTVVARWSQAFETVLDHDGEINVAKLLEACSLVGKDILNSGETIQSSLNAREIQSNVKKSSSSLHLVGPGSSMKQLLQREKDTGLHVQRHDGYRLHETSSAMGLLWLRRTLEMQAEIFRLLLLNNGEPQLNVAIAAYYKTLRNHHGWALRKICEMALRIDGGSKSTTDWLLRYDEDNVVGSDRLEHIKSDIREFLSIWEPIREQWVLAFRSLQLEDQRRA